MRAYNYYNATPVGYGSTQNMAPGGNLQRGRQGYGSSTQIWRASNSNLSMDQSDGRYSTVDNRNYQPGSYPRSESVTQEIINDRQGNVDFTRTITRTSNFDRGSSTLYSTNPYATWKRYSKPDLSTIGGPGSFPNSGGSSLADSRRKMVFSSQSSLNNPPSTNTMYHHVNPRSYSNSPATKPAAINAVSSQPVTVSFYTSNRQRNRITPRVNNETSIPPSNAPFGGNTPSGGAHPPPRPLSSMGSRISSVTSLDVTRPLQVSASHWQPIKSKRDEGPPTLERRNSDTNKAWQVGVYAKDLFPSAEQVRKMAQLVSQSLFDPRNMQAKGGRMFRRRQERAAQYTYEGYGRNVDPLREFATVPSTLDDLQEKAKEHKVERIAKDFIQSGIPLPPNPEELLNRANDLRRHNYHHHHHHPPQQFSVYDPESGRHRVIRATNFDVDLSDEEPCEHNIVTPNVCNMIVRDLKGGRGRGSSMFQKRHEKSLRWVTDETNRREKSYGIVEAIKTGRITEDALEKSLNKMHQSRPERLPSMTSVIKQLTPWEAAAEGIPLESTMKSGAQIMAEAMSKASMMNDRRPPARVFNPIQPVSSGHRTLNLSQTSINNSMNQDYDGEGHRYNPNQTWGGGRGGYDSGPGSRPTSAVPFMPPKGAVAMPGLVGLSSAEGRGPGGFRASLQTNKEPKKWRPMNYNSSTLPPSASNNTMISAEL
ncbi:uncharacterized protein LOC142348224 isoform X2 [Convolutriloba macropyga]|uniref:uncharacterized protein LOC142348224 isoform X2 n=1 Tax=Convolutriloba macropyga TaxID=536237 RepID=UPI003F5258BB